MPVSKHTQCDTPPEVLVLPRPLFLSRHKTGGELLLKKYTPGFEAERLTTTM